jgi:hypothetical protein
MTVHAKTTIKSYFEQGDTPTGSQFSDLIDSYQDASPVLNYITTAAVTAASGQMMVSNGAGSFVFIPVNKVKYDGDSLTIGAPLNVSGNANFTGNTSFINVTVSGLAIVSALNATGDVAVSGALTAGRITDWHSFYVDTPANQTYQWVKSAPYAFTLQGIRRVAGAGDCNIDIRKNNSSLAVYSASAAVASAALSGSFAVGDNLTVVITSASSCTTLSVFAQITRAL